MPSYRMSQGIVCASPSLTITPYLTDSWSFARPKESITRTPIYDEDTGAIKYYSEIPRFEKDNFNLNYGISAQLNIPLGKSPALCHEATAVNIEAQRLLIKKLKWKLASIVWRCVQKWRKMELHLNLILLVLLLVKILL